MRLPFFGLLSPKSPMNGLIEHYTKISECVHIIKDSLACYVSGSGVCREFEELLREIDAIEDHADKIKRNIRNHMPRHLIMPVDKTLFLNYTKGQDNILDEAQDALHWLGMRKVYIPEQFQKAVIELLEHVAEAAQLLEPALNSTIGLVHGEHLDREGCKMKYRKVRQKRDDISRFKRKLLSEIFNSDMDFKDIYQLTNFIGCLSEMVKNCEFCVDTLRAMIVR